VGGNKSATPLELCVGNNTPNEGVLGQVLSSSSSMDTESQLPKKGVVATPAPTHSMLLSKQLSGALKVLLTLPRDTSTVITINRKDCAYYVDEITQHGVSSMTRTHHFNVKGRISEELYWYQQYAAILTPSHAYLEFCALSNGDVCVGVWETRCAKPFHALLVFMKQKEQCELFTAHNHRTIFPGVVFDPTATFDMDLMQK
jgi:hypothetical protein